MAIYITFFKCSFENFQKLSKTFENILKYSEIFFFLYSETKKTKA